ncbi:YoaK family protein [Streptomyces sp. NBC_00828]|uniref:YoaK family protein n=1 Tax=Streptomyces sp. NBC_00828 TaxID=2903678 RepID=UPI0038678D95
MQWSSLETAHRRRARLERSRDVNRVSPTVPVQSNGGAEPVDDRRVDLAAAHAAPELLAIRDRLLVALAFSSGVFEAICFLSFGKVFTAFQTGNLVFLGLGAAGTRPPAGPDPVRVVISLAAFAVGAALAARILTALNGDDEIEDTDIFEAWPQRVSIALGVALLAQVGFLVVWMTMSPSSPVSNILVALNAFAMGLQMNAIRSLHVPGISTTAATATYISWVAGITTWTHKAAAARRLTGVLVGMVAGAFVGNWMLNHAHTYAPVLPVAVIALVVAIASVTLRQEPAR